VPIIPVKDPKGDDDDTDPKPSHEAPPAGDPPGQPQPQQSLPGAHDTMHAGPQGMTSRSARKQWGKRR
jgi:hypothetical protein